MKTNDRESCLGMATSNKRPNMPAEPLQCLYVGAEIKPSPKYSRLRLLGDVHRLVQFEVNAVSQDVNATNAGDPAHRASLGHRNDPYPIDFSSECTLVQALHGSSAQVRPRPRIG